MKIKRLARLAFYVRAALWLTALLSPARDGREH